jgi:hypothetical protein
MDLTNSCGVTGAKLRVNEDNTTHDLKSISTRGVCLRLRSNMRLIDCINPIYAVSHGISNILFTSWQTEFSGLLPKDAFGERGLRVNRFHERYTYSHFINGKSKDNFARNRSEYVPICVIERHMSDEADQLLDFLPSESGAPQIA